MYIYVKFMISDVYFICARALLRVVSGHEQA